MVSEPMTDSAIGPPGLTYSTSTIATSQMPTTPPSKKARGTLRRMGEEDEDDGEKV